MILTLKQYNHLLTHQKAVLICSECALVDMELKKEIIYTLYSYSSFFVEVRVNNCTKELIDITAFRNGKKLEKYLNKINLQEMINE
ncbi:MAG: hypothetical protein V4635_07750 [Bacteroidota bacterium]